MRTNVDALLLARRGLVVVPGSARRPDERVLRGLDAELAELGYALSYRLRAALGGSGAAGDLDWLLVSLRAVTGADQAHQPLFRRFPDDIPADTTDLWWTKFAAYYLQSADQPCLWCGDGAVTHLLSPCAHVVCERCFDGSTYSACPVCEQPVDRPSPFFRPSRADRVSVPREDVRLKRLDLAEDRDAAVVAWLKSLCGRTQPMSPDDVAALVAIVHERGEAALSDLPAAIPVRENVGHVFGTLLQVVPSERVLPAAAPYLASATDLLRILAVWSGHSPALPARTRARVVPDGSVWGRVKQAVRGRPGTMPVLTLRFPIRRLDRRQRRALLGILDGFPFDKLAEDMLRHQSVWKRVGEVLHPGEHRRPFPTAARAFDVVRGREPFVAFGGRVEALRRAGDTRGLVAQLAQRPGELWRRADDLLRHAADPDPVIEELVARIPAAPVPLLMTVRAGMATRGRPLPYRVFFPRGEMFTAPSASDDRAPLAAELRDRLVTSIDEELLARFGRLPRFAAAVVDDALVDVIVPFNERTGAKAAVALPRGSTLDLPQKRRTRLFLHWCQARTDQVTDLDLSVAFYDADWELRGTCSYSHLREGTAATHSGDLRGAPPPQGATEFVDVDVEAAREAGWRYAVMVVNAYSGMTFGGLERAYAGLMLRDDLEGRHFDPRTVELKFELRGAHGVYAPLVLDLVSQRLLWIDASSKGAFRFNNVQSSNRRLSRIGPAMIGYFGARARPSLRDLALLHAAARTDRVWLRGEATRRVDRHPGEPVAAFHRRLREGQGRIDGPELDGPVFAALVRGDLGLPPGSLAYALFPGALTDTIAASDLLVAPRGHGSPASPG